MSNPGFTRITTFESQREDADKSDAEELSAAESPITQSLRSKIPPSGGFQREKEGLINMSNIN